MSISRQLQENTPSNLSHLWVQEIDESLAYFNQVEFDCPASLSACYGYYQRTREQVETAMLAAYRYMSNHLGFYPVTISSYQDFPFSGSSGRRLRAHLNTGRIHSLGKASVASVEPDASVAYSKSDAALSYNDIATISVSSTAQVKDIVVRFKPADCPFDFASADDARLEIKPLSITTDGATVTIKGNASLFAKPSLQFADDTALIDPTESSNFVTGVNVYARSLDFDTPAEVLTLAEARKPVAEATVETTLTDTRLEDSATGLISIPGFNSSVENAVVRVHYVAGYKTLAPGSIIEPTLGKALVYLACTLMQEFPHSVNEQAYRNWAYYRELIEAMDMTTGRDKVARGELESMRIMSAYNSRQWGAS